MYICQDCGEKFENKINKDLCWECEKKKIKEKWDKKKERKNNIKKKKEWKKQKESREKRGLFNITINIPENYDKNIQLLIKEGQIASRSEAVRTALREFLSKELNFNLKLFNYPLEDL